MSLDRKRPEKLRFGKIELKKGGFGKDTNVEMPCLDRG